MEGLACTDLEVGPAVVLIHGHPFDRSMWSGQHGPLTEAGFRVLAPDLRGYGASEVVAGTATMADLAGDVSALIDRRGLGGCAVVGLSMGGLVAMELAARRDDLWALGLVATTADPVTDAERERRDALAAVAERDGVTPLLESMEGLWHPFCPPGVVADVTAMMRAAHPAGAAAALRGRALRPDYRPGLRRVRIPTWVCVGTEDPWSTAAVTEAITTNLTDPEVVVLPGVGHLPNMEAPALFNRALLEFLRRSVPPTAP